MKLFLLCLCSVVAIVAGQRITTIQLDGVQYFVSRMNPYSPELNYFLAYQYCRSLGLQLASFETKEKVESMSQYLQNAGYSKYDFWTSGNRLGTGMFLWMSTGLPFNATFDYFENSNDAVSSGLLDPIDHNSNTSPQRTARDSSSGLEKGCVILQAPELKWAPEDCSEVKDFICEQTRCYYYNYGSIPVSSAQGRPIIGTTPPTTTTTEKRIVTTPVPVLLTQSTTLTPNSDSAEDTDDQPASPYGALKILIDSTSTEHAIDDFHQAVAAKTEENESIESIETTPHSSEDEIPAEEHADLADHEESSEKSADKVEETTSVEQRLRKISEEIEKYSSNSAENDDSLGRQSFFSLSDLIKTLRPTDKKIPQIDSDYSNTMRVLGETSSIVSSGDEARKSKESAELKLSNRALH